jgi:hypothetical protein
MKARDDDSEGFVMMFTEETAISVIGGMRHKRLQPRDLAVLMALMTEMNWRNGKVEITQRALAEQLGIQETNCSTSIRRLQSQRLVARMRDPRSGNTYFLINPRLVAVGGPQRRGFLLQQFDEAIGAA